jgi:hypothetical protein
MSRPLKMVTLMRNPLANKMPKVMPTQPVSTLMAQTQPTQSPKVTPTKPATQKMVPSHPLSPPTMPLIKVNQLHSA